MTYHFALPLANFSGAAAQSSGGSAQLKDLERDAMLRFIPALRRFAKSLTGNSDSADDLVQEALVRAIANIDSFQSGTNMQAWLLTILRNAFITQYRQQRHELAYKTSLRANPVSSYPNQYSTLQLRELEESLANVPAPQRRALLLIFVYGYSYREAAAICHCPAGTIKSRANRARVQIAKLMHVGHVDDFGPDERDLAVVAATGLGETKQAQLH